MLILSACQWLIVLRLSASWAWDMERLKPVQFSAWIKGDGLLYFGCESISQALPGSRMARNPVGSFHSELDLRISNMFQMQWSLHLNPQLEFSSSSSDEMLVTTITLYHNYFLLTDTQNFCKTFLCSEDINTQHTWMRRSADQMLSTDIASVRSMEAICYM